MRKLLNIYTLASLMLVSLFVYGQTIERGIPFFKSFSAKEYDANNQNFDVQCDDYGTVFVANFEGLLYYDGATWRKILTPGISRVTRVEKGPDGKIWIGGYNVFGYLVADERGNLSIKALMSDENSKGTEEFDAIKIISGQVFGHTTLGTVYKVEKGDKLVKVVSGAGHLFSSTTTSSLTLPDGVKVNYDNTTGLRFVLPNGSFSDISETNGLISNAINDVTFNNKNTLWGATANGLFCAEVATPYSKISDAEGLKGEVYAINQIGNIIYIGTQNGIYTLRDGNIEQLPGMDVACWDFVKDKSGRLIAPTSDGLFIISAGGLKKVTEANTLSVCLDASTQEIIVGETDGIFRVNEAGKHEQISKLGKVMYLTHTGDKLLATTIYGSQWELSADPSKNKEEKCLNKEAKADTPCMEYTDRSGRHWVTDGDGYNLKMTSKNNDDKKIIPWIYPLTLLSVDALYVCEDGNIIAGGEFGIIVIADAGIKNTKIGNLEKPYIRSVSANDSILWGGYSPNTLKPITDIEDIDVPRDKRDVTVTFSSHYNSLVCPTKYRYRLNDGVWSKWSEDASVTFKNAEYGNGTLEIQAMDNFGRESGVSMVHWYIHYPLYMRWWTFIIYALILVGIVSLYFRWRTKRLQKEKMKLEGIVEERTSELRDTLDDLKRTQSDLVRMERTATAGKLTQGLIDRILNPINYINNFSKLTSNLAKDLKEDIEDEKENMSEDNYEDCEDILDMMGTNLQKIEEHGVNTTRTLRAMEAMLNNNIGTLVEQDILPICSQAIEVTKEYHKKDIQECGIKVSFEKPDSPVMVNMDAEAMNRVLLSLLTNSIYAVAKRYGQSPYEAEVSLKIENGESVVITIHDNGIGIEDAIKEKVFDPFFTTKPTGEAAGVGLYLVRELIHDHNGDISLSSVQGQFTDFVITLPK